VFFLSFFFIDGLCAVRGVQSVGVERTSRGIAFYVGLDAHRLFQLAVERVEFRNPKVISYNLRALLHNLSWAETEEVCLVTCCA
jgi:hypothetical protein